MNDEVKNQENRGEPVNNLLVDRFPVLRVVLLANARVDVVKLDASNVGSRPNGNWTPKKEQHTENSGTHKMKWDENPLVPNWKNVFAIIFFLLRTAGVPVFADDPAVTGRRRNADSLAHQEAEPGRVQVRPGPDDAVLGEATQLPRHVRQNVHWKEQIHTELDTDFRQFRESSERV